jgi:hypothetical protein
MRLRNRLLGLISIGISVAGTLMAAELLLRLLPVNEGLRALPVNAQQPVFRFQPNRTSTWSEGWNFEIVNRVHVNYDGFVNDRDYDAVGTSPLLVVVGDSYIEAGIVPFVQTVHGRLATTVQGRGRVYSFGASGAGLPQYLVWLAHARDRYSPNAAMVSIVANDFSESLYHRGRSPGFHHFSRQPDGSAELVRVDYEPSFLRRALRRSALVMYLVTNVKVQQVLHLTQMIQNLGKKDQRWAANVPYTSTAEEYADYQWATDRFLERLPTAAGLPPEKIILTLDAVRPEIYDPAQDEAAAQGTWGQMRAYVRERATAMGFVVLDLGTVFRASFERDGRRFEYPSDNHWNGHGHEVVAMAVTSTPLFRKTFFRK